MEDRKKEEQQRTIVGKCRTTNLGRSEGGKWKTTAVE